MFVRIDVNGLIDQQNGNFVFDSVGLAQTRVVEQSVTDEQQRSPVSRTYQDFQQLLIDHGRYGNNGGGASCPGAGAGGGAA